MTPEVYLLIEAKIKKELENLHALERELAAYGLYPTVSATTLGGFALTDAAALRIVGSILHDYYTALEKIFETVATRIDRSLPRGDTWHKELLEQMTLDVPGLRPPLISAGTARRLDPYRGFRHVFRNVYGYSLSPGRVMELLKDLPALAAAVKDDLSCFTLRLSELMGMTN